MQCMQCNEGSPNLQQPLTLYFPAEHEHKSSCSAGEIDQLTIARTSPVKALLGLSVTHDVRDLTPAPGVKASGFRTQQAPATQLRREDQVTSVLCPVTAANLQMVLQI